MSSAPLSAPHPEQGVDYFTIHAGVLLRYVPLTANRMTGIVSRGDGLRPGSIYDANDEAPFYTLGPLTTDIAPG